MPATRQTSRRHLRRPWAGVLLALALLSAFVDGAAGVTKEEVADAEARVTRLEREIRARETRLEILQEVAASLAAELSLAQGELERIGWELSETRARLATAQSKYERLRARLDGRAREAYMDGPASGLEFLLGSTSLADLSDRIEFVNSVVQADAELASRVGNVENRLAKEARLLDVLRTRKADYVGRLRRQGDELTSRLSEQLAILEDIDANRARAERLARKLGHEYREQQTAQVGGAPGDDPFEVCPVGQPRAFGDDFGAPRYSGGYHPHAGNDIFAPMGTPVFAPFDGVAEPATNGLGGLSAIVRGGQGWVYNAHLSRFGTLGRVSAGDVIGYVGDSGNAVGTSPHDHFEWHPNVIPPSWPASGYGYSVIADAVNPRPLLLEVC
ncbi:MAG TPA: peptidoglycan DD-metalloendopeptidase family protein [Actinomycetota bacterium]|nr:peptidoglycan DD-metalloendopeptidase family protein [Actinomycetota bacterium]